MAFEAGAFRRAKGKGVNKVIFEQYSDLGSPGSGLYRAGGETHVVSTLESVRGAFVQVQSGLVYPTVVAVSSNAYRVQLRTVSGAQTSGGIAELAATASVSGVWIINALVIGE